MTSGSENWTRGEDVVLGADPSVSASVGELIVSMVVLERNKGR